MTPNERFDEDVKRDVESRVREGVKALLKRIRSDTKPTHFETLTRAARRFI